MVYMCRIIRASPTSISLSTAMSGTPTIFQRRAPAGDLRGDGQSLMVRLASRIGPVHHHLKAVFKCRLPHSRGYFASENPVLAIWSAHQTVSTPPPAVTSVKRMTIWSEDMSLVVTLIDVRRTSRSEVYS